MDKKQLILSLQKHGFSEEIILAFEKVDREKFIPSIFKKFAYVDEPISIGHDQTISQPSTIAFMLDLLELEDNQKILEVGSGSGYVLALISEISKKSKIFGAERIKGLADRSKKNSQNYKQIKVIFSDGSKGLKAYAPFDRILVSASAGEIPEKLVEQLKDNGILVCPVRNNLTQIKKSDGEIVKKEFPGFAFVPLIKGDLK